MNNRSRTALAALMLFSICDLAAAAGRADLKAAGDEPDIVFGSGPSRAMSLGAPKSSLLAPSASSSTAVRAWTVETKDVNLANTFQRWASSAGWKVRWDAAKHVMLEAPDTFNGTFEDAVEAQLSSPGIAMSAYPLEVCFYPNVPPLARITRKGDQSKECK